MTLQDTVQINPLELSVNDKIVRSLKFAANENKNVIKQIKDRVVQFTQTAQLTLRQKIENAPFLVRIVLTPLLNAHEKVKDAAFKVLWLMLDGIGIVIAIIFAPLIRVVIGISNIILALGLKALRNAVHFSAEKLNVQ